ncbi:MAG: 3-phosphoshikimate 1-carboxyvinyltransferase [Candidatus Micrarchaeia archaeon]
MKKIQPGAIGGTVAAPASKSMMQRAVAAAALAGGKSIISNPSDCDDAKASIGCAQALGARVSKKGGSVEITGGRPEKGGVLDCHESGLSLRMFTPIAALYGHEFTITGTGSILKRPVGMVQKPLARLGAKCSTNNGLPPIRVRGPLKGGKTSVDGSTSSQFVTGLLMALPKCENDSEINVAGLKSRPYVQMTMQLLGRFGIGIGADEELARFSIEGGQEYSPAKYNVEGDWSGAAFLLVAGAIAGNANVTGLDMESLQADRAVLEALELAGAKTVFGNNGLLAQNQGELEAFEFDATECPDLFPPLAALAANCKGTTRIKGASRLAGKESDRGLALVQEFGRLGCKIRVSGDAMEITGSKLAGGIVEAHNDHRIAMACAVAALNASAPVSITGEECVAKSYPGFFEDLESLRQDR